METLILNNNQMKKTCIDLEIFLSECKKAFRFLVDEYQFLKSETVNKENIFEVIFRKNNLAIECSYDVRDSITSIYIVKMDNGKRPDCYRVNKKGEVVREHLSIILRSQGVNPSNLKVESYSKSLSDPRLSLRKYLENEAFILRTYGEKILNGSTEVFNELIPDNGDQF